MLRALAVILLAAATLVAAQEQSEGQMVAVPLAKLLMMLQTNVALHETLQATREELQRAQREIEAMKAKLGCA